MVCYRFYKVKLKIQESEKKYLEKKLKKTCKCTI
ncbi:hypothetical protein T08_5724 [Trichinella sp. T8]|nr:hypothetical protein T08_5724 [Trichinella sp. T8]